MNISKNTISNYIHWTPVIVTVVFALFAFTIQWGVVNARLDGVEKRLDELLVESRAMRNIYGDIERRVAFLEGMTSSSKEHKDSK